MKSDQRGFTLVELLATVTILSIIGVIIWSVFIQGVKYSQNSASKNTIQQEANIVITSLTKIHQTASEYVLDSTDCTITVEVTYEDSSTQTYEFSQTDLCFSVNQTGAVNPNDANLPVILSIYEIEDPRNKVEVDTILYKLKDGDYSG